MASLSYALFSLINRDLASHYSGIKISFFEQGVLVAALIPTLFFCDFSLTVKDTGILLLSGIFLTALPYVLFINGQKKVNAQTGAVISGLEVVYSIVFALILLSEIPSPRTILGGIVILGAAALSTLLSSKDSAAICELSESGAEAYQSH